MRRTVPVPVLTLGAPTAAAVALLGPGVARADGQTGSSYRSGAPK